MSAASLLWMGGALRTVLKRVDALERELEALRPQRPHRPQQRRPQRPRPQRPRPSSPDQAPEITLSNVLAEPEGVTQRQDAVPTSSSPVQAQEITLSNGAVAADATVTVIEESSTVSAKQVRFEVPVPEVEDPVVPVQPVRRRRPLVPCLDGDVRWPAHCCDFQPPARFELPVRLARLICDYHSGKSVPFYSLSMADICDMLEECEKHGFHMLDAELSSLLEFESEDGMGDFG